MNRGAIILTAANVSISLTKILQAVTVYRYIVKNDLKSTCGATGIAF